ncbi:hypothetical protein Nmel_011607, partial [Mimus melanotis]
TAARSLRGVRNGNRTEGAAAILARGSAAAPRPCVRPGSTAQPRAPENHRLASHAHSASGRAPRCQVGDGSETVTVTAAAVMGTGTEPVEAQCDSLDG